jgi:hypothetical protein
VLLGPAAGECGRRDRVRASDTVYGPRILILEDSGLGYSVRMDAPLRNSTRKFDSEIRHGNSTRKFDPASRPSPSEGNEGPLRVGARAEDTAALAQVYPAEASSLQRASVSANYVGRSYLLYWVSATQSYLLYRVSAPPSIRFTTSPAPALLPRSHPRSLEF